MELRKILRAIDLFEGLSPTELDEIIAICQQKTFHKGDLLATEGEMGEEFFVLMEGLVEILINSKGPYPKVVTHLGVGQIIGEMSLVDKGPRSATVRVVQNPTIVQVIRHQDFHNLCKHNYRIGYIVMNNIAADLSFKLRHRHLSEI